MKLPNYCEVSMRFLVRSLLVTLMFAVIAAVALGYGIYVYPQYPALVWVMLFVCWACYRLGLRAHEIGVNREQRRVSRLKDIESATTPENAPLPQ